MNAKSIPVRSATNGPTKIAKRDLGIKLGNQDWRVYYKSKEMQNVRKFLDAHKPK
jgi:hypothetical protein